MKDIKLNELTTVQEISAEDAEVVKGGPAYMKLGDIKGEVRDSRSVPTENFSLNFEKIK